MVNQHSSPDIATLHIRPGVRRDLGGERKGAMRYDLSTANDPRTDIRIKTNTKQEPTKVKTPISDHNPPSGWSMMETRLRRLWRVGERKVRGGGGPAPTCCSHLLGIRLCFRVTKERRILFPHFPYRILISTHRRTTAHFVMPM
ncbi:hypothetical protein E2C01_004447 [Portunus trituberculatus]|uniref:Uncharacterized protein n=1 Tax=Portunus trituberculatus TaxID=210409 RepID=A0A5B7CQ00_PORTR|nr:hypothetical protein [Portunus trituberculatus]